MYAKEFRDLLKENPIHIKNPYLNEIIRKFSFHVITQDNSYEIIQQKINNSIIVIDEINDCTTKTSFFIICFNYSIIIIPTSAILLLTSFFSSIKETSIYYFTKGIKKKIPNYQSLHSNFHKLTDKHNQEIISNFLKYCELIYDVKKKTFQKLIWKFVGKCISVFLIQNGFINSMNDKLYNREIFFQQNYDIEIKNDEYINLEYLVNGSFSFINLVYLIKKKRICVLKMFSNEDEKNLNLYEREHENYLHLHHPLVPQYFGTSKVNQMKSLFIEYFGEKTLDEVNMDQISIQNKTKILFDIMIIIEYFHSNKLIYRDLKPNNIVIDIKYSAYIIDFDRMVKFTDQNKFYNELLVYNEYYSPELKEGRQISSKTDIYSLGKLISFFKFENESKKYANELKKLHEIELKCTLYNENERPNIEEIIDDFYLNFFVKIFNLFENDDILTISKYHGRLFSKYWYFIAECQNPEIQMKFAFIYINGFYIYLNGGIVSFCLKNQFKQNEKYEEIHYIPPNFNKAINFFTLAANNGNSDAQYYLGVFYLKKQDINKSLHYYLLSVKQNHPGAGYDLGSLYFEGKYVKKDINKSIYYYTISANQNYASAQFDLGQIYLTINITKSLQYLNLAANQKYSKAFFVLGAIYNKGEYVPYDIDKSIYYFEKAASLKLREADDILQILRSPHQKSFVNDIINIFFGCVNQESYAQYYIGLFYYSDHYHDIEKSIYYLSLSAHQNNPYAQNMIGYIFYNGKYIDRNINVAIYFYQLASDQNFPDAQYNLGLIYYEGKYIKQEINIAIKLLSLAASKNHPKAQFKIGMIYLNGNYVPRNINKAIYYFTLAANQDHTQAQYNLGVLFADNSYTEKDINKSIYYYSLAAKKKHLMALHDLGAIYYNNHDVEKSISYLKTAADLNHDLSQCELGFIYYCSNYIATDIYKAIFYFTLAANQDNTRAQFYLGLIYSQGKHVARNINKAIQYYTKAAKKNYISAQYNLGMLYIKGKYVKKDVKKALNYFSNAAKLNSVESQYTLGLIYEKGKYAIKDINKAVYYYTLAARQNEKNALFSLGNIYYYGINNQKNVVKGIQYFELSALNNHIYGNFYTGYFYHEGKYIKRNIKKAIHFYKEASSFNNSFAKNNLGIIYKNGFGNEIRQNLGNAIIYFEEAIRCYKENCISMYNLAQLYFYENIIENGIDKSICLLIMSSELGCCYSKDLLCISLVRKYGFNLDLIKTEIEKENKNKLAEEICAKIINMRLNNFIVYEELYKYYRNIDLIFSIDEYFPSKKLLYIDSIDTKALNISSSFYEGFGLEI